MDDPRDDGIVTAVVGELDGIFRPFHVDLAQNAKETRSEVAELRATVAQLSGTVANLLGTVTEMATRLAEIEEPAGYAMQLGIAMGAETGANGTPSSALPLVPGARRPASVDRACAVAGSPDARPAVIPQQHGNLVIHPKRGYSAVEVYDDVVQSIQDARSQSSERSASETTGLRRARRARKR